MPRGVYDRSKSKPRHKHSEETRRKLADCQRGRIKSKEEREKLSNSLKGHIPWNKGRPWTEEEKENIRRGLKKYYECSPPCKIWDNPTSIEIKVAEQLLEYGIKFVYQKPICGAHFILDFWLPDYQLVIECNGDYWHSRPERKARDKELEEYVFSKGKDILWLWEHEINDEWFDISDYLEI